MSEDFGAEGFGERVKLARGRKRFPDGGKWTQTDLAKNVGVVLNTVSEWERGERLPRDPGVLSKLARVLDVSVEWLLGHDDHAPLPSARIQDGRVMVDYPNTYEWTDPRIRVLPVDARRLLLDYEDRMKRAGLPDEAIAHFGRSIFELTVGKHYADANGGEIRSDVDWIKLVNASWAIVSAEIVKAGWSI